MSSSAAGNNGATTLSLQDFNRINDMSPIELGGWILQFLQTGDPSPLDLWQHQGLPYQVLLDLIADLLPPAFSRLKERMKDQIATLIESVSPRDEHNSSVLWDLITMASRLRVSSARKPLVHLVNKGTLRGKLGRNVDLHYCAIDALANIGVSDSETFLLRTRDLDDERYADVAFRAICQVHPELAVQYFPTVVRLIRRKKDSHVIAMSVVRRLVEAFDEKGFASQFSEPLFRFRKQTEMNLIIHALRSLYPNRVENMLGAMLRVLNSRGYQVQLVDIATGSGRTKRVAQIAKGDFVTHSTNPVLIAVVRNVCHRLTVEIRRKAHDEIVKLVKEQYSAFSEDIEYIHILRNSLDLLCSDLELAMAGWKLHFCIDCGEMFALAFPTSELRHIGLLPGETPEQAYAREKVTLAFLFTKAISGLLSNTNNLVLLPPYAEEMRLTLELMKLRLINLNSLMSIYRGAGQHLFVGTHFRDERIEKITREYASSGQPLSEGARREIANYIALKYQDLSAYVISPSHHGAMWINNIISSELVMPLNRYLRRYFPRSLTSDLALALNPTDIQERSRTYLPKFAAHPWRTHRVMANKIDAEACAILDVLNERLKDRREIAMLISHAPTMKAAIGSVGIYERPDHISRMTSGVRDLNYLWTYFIFSEEYDTLATQQDIGYFRQAVLDRVKRESNLLSDFLHMIEQFRDRLDVSNAEYGRAEKILVGWKSAHMKYANLSLATKTNDKLLNLINQAALRAMPEFRKRVQWGRNIFDIITIDEMMQELLANQDQLGHTIETYARTEKELVSAIADSQEIV